VIKEGSMTLLEHMPYICIKIESGVAHLKKVGDETRGRFRKMEANLVPYLDEKGKLIVPKPPPVNRKRMLRFHFMKVIKEEVDLPVSHDLAYFVAEWLSDLVMFGAHEAENNALRRGDDKITSAHWPPNRELSNQRGYWEQNKEYAKDYKQYLKER
tara:strand:+ start:3480 stop:3947 length:468 start_codon:yes stop_codon:yes gene_type:complete